VTCGLQAGAKMSLNSPAAAQWAVEPLVGNRATVIPELAHDRGFVKSMPRYGCRFAVHGAELAH